MKSTHPGILDEEFSELYKFDNGGNGKSKHSSRSENIFFQIAQNARDLIFHAQLVPEFRFDYVSPSSIPIAGYTPEEFYADPLLAKRCIHPDDLHLITDPGHPGAQIPTEPVEIRWIRKDGVIIWTEHMVTYTRDEEGKPISCQIIARDVTERKKAEDALLESQQFSASLLENAPLATVVINPDTSIEYVNPAWERLNGWTMAEVVGQKVPYPWWPEQFKKAFSNGFKESMKQGSGKAEIVSQKKNGELYWIDMNWASVMKNGELSYLLINSIDITERKQIEEALKSSEEKYRELISTSLDGIVSIDSKMKITIWNQGAERIFGYTEKEMLGQSIFKIVSEPSRKAITGRCSVTEKTDLTPSMNHSFEATGVRKDGTIIPIDLSLTSRKVDGKHVATAIIRDISERNLMEKALRESEEKFSLAFNASPHMIIITDITDGKYIEVNDTFVNNTGYTREEFIGHSVSEFDLWAKPEEMEKMTRLLQEHGRFRNEEYDFRTKSGEIRSWLCSADVVSIGGKMRMLAIAADITERKKAREALRESEEKFSRAFNASPISLSISRLGDGVFLEVNESFLRDKEFTRDEVIGHSSKKLGIWASQAEQNRIMDMLKKQGRVHNEQIQYCTKSGYVRTGLISAEIISIGNESCMLVLNNDITQQKQAEEQLRLLSSVTKQVSDSIIVTDPEFRINFMNQAAEDLFGYSIEEVRGKNLGIFNKTPPADETRQLARRTVAAGKVYSAIVAKQRKDGTTLICDCRLSPMYDEKGQICSLIDVQRDITKQKDVEEKLQEHKKLIDSILATMLEGVLVIDSQDRILLANKALYKILHLNRKSINNKLLSEILPLDQYFDLHRAVKYGNNETNTLEFRYHVQDLEKIIYCIIVKMDGERTLLTFSDVSREREEEEKLYLTDRLASIGEMAAGLAHELNNPLTGILTLSQLLVGSDIPEEQKEDLECIYSEAKRAAGIVKNVLLFARNKTDDTGRASVNEVIKDVLRLREYEERASNIRAVTELEENLPDIPIDKGQLQQVFLNMISNAEAAIKEANRPGILTVTSQRVNNHVNILFSDNGCGIKKQIMPRIFDPFFTTKEVGKGTGLGLSICYSIIVKRGGIISVKSQVNEGSTFTIRMPIVM